MQIVSLTLAALALASGAVSAPTGSTEVGAALSPRELNNLFFYDDENFGGSRIVGYTLRTPECLVPAYGTNDLRGRMSSFKIPFAKCWFYKSDNCMGEYVYAQNVSVRNARVNRLSRPAQDF